MRIRELKDSEALKNHCNVRYDYELIELDILEMSIICVANGVSFQS